jgi:hypothetical protein
MEAADFKFKLGGLIQPQYKSTDPSTGSSTDTLRLRRLRTVFSGELHKDWKGVAQIDFGLSNTAIRGAYINYKGFENVDLRIGSTVAHFSRETLTTNKKQFLIERTFTGDHNYGAPLFQTGIHLKGHDNSKTFTWGTTLAVAAHDPDEKKIDFEDTIQIDNKKNDTSDWSDGLMIAARAGWHPFGIVANSQGILKKERKWCIEAAAFSWKNDGDNLKAGGHGGGTKYDLDKVTAFEISSALRFDRVALDLQYNIFDAQLEETGITSGVYKNSSTELKQFSAEGAFAFVVNKFEWVLGYEQQDADNYAKAWSKSSTGCNYYIKGHDLKLQATYSKGKNKDGASGSDVDEFYTMLQLIF